MDDIVQSDWVENPGESSSSYIQPLLNAQIEMLAGHLIDDTGIQYNASKYVEITGDFDVKAFTEAVRRAVAAIEAVNGGVNSVH